jgi:hypothetical protein
MIEITDRYPNLLAYEVAKKQVIAPQQDGLYWIGIYPPMDADKRLPAAHARQLCPWTMAAELTGNATSAERRQHIIGAFNDGQWIMKQFNLPSNRIMFVEDNLTRRVTVWVD